MKSLRRMLALLLQTSLVVSLGCGQEVEVHQYDRNAVTALQSYQAQYELNEQGRVVDIRLDGEHVNDEALALLANLTELKSLSLYGSSITDNGLKHLIGLGRLESLGIGKTQITDRGLVGVGQIPNLKWLWIGESPKITKQGVSRLKKARPQLKVYQ